MNENILKIPYAAVNNDWDLLQKFLELKGNPKYILVGDVNLRRRQDIPNLGSLVGVDGDLDLGYSSIESLGELQFVGSNLWIDDTNIPPSEINKVEVGGKILR
jgi:hypothetical protein